MALDELKHHALAYPAFFLQACMSQVFLLLSIFITIKTDWITTSVRTGGSILPNAMVIFRNSQKNQSLSSKCSILLAVLLSVLFLIYVMFHSAVWNVLTSWVYESVCHQYNHITTLRPLNIFLMFLQKVAAALTKPNGIVSNFWIPLPKKAANIHYKGLGFRN